MTEFHWLTPARRVMGVFFMHGFLLANWYPRIPDVQTALGIGPAELAIGLMGMSLGSFVSLPFAGHWIEKLHPRRVLIISLVTYCVTLSLPGWSWNVPSLFIGLLILGLMYPVVDVAMNVEAVSIQQHSGRRILSTCHGFWSIGSMVGAIIGGAIAQIGIGVGIHLLLIGAIMLPVSLFLALGLPEAGRQAEKAVGAVRFALPSLSILALCLFCTAMVVVEASARNWSAVYLRDIMAASPAVTGLGFGVFAGFMAIGRFLGDRLTEKFGAVRLARLSCLTAVAGIAIVVVAQDIVQAMIGFAAAGLGSSVIFPLTIAAAASRGDRPAPVNVAAVALVVALGALLAPPVVGFVAQGAGLRWGWSVLLPLAILSTLLVGELARRAPARSMPH